MQLWLAVLLFVGAHTRHLCTPNSSDCPLVVSAFPKPPCVYKPIVDSTGTHYDKGLEIQIIQTIAQANNFTIRYRPLPRLWNNFTSLIKDVASGRSHVALAGLGLAGEWCALADPSAFYHQDSVQWFVPSGRQVPRWKSVVRMFEPTLWLLVVVSLLAVSFTLSLLARYCFHVFSPFKEASLVLLLAMNVLLGQSLPLQPRTALLRAFFMVWVLSSLVINCAYQSSIVSFLVNPGLLPALKTLDDILDSGIRVGFRQLLFQYFRSYDDVRYNTILNGRNYEFCSDMDSCLRRAAFGDMAVASSKVTTEYEIALKYNRDGIRLLESLEENIVTYGFVMYLPKRSPLLTLFNRFILRLVESGLIRQWWEQLTNYRDVKRESSTGTRTVLVLQHLQGPFLLLALGLALAALVFLAEHATVAFTRVRSRKFQTAATPPP